jgi:hypothetical protein
MSKQAVADDVDPEQRVAASTRGGQSAPGIADRSFSHCTLHFFFFFLGGGRGVALIIAPLVCPKDGKRQYFDFQAG